MSLRKPIVEIVYETDEYQFGTITYPDRSTYHGYIRKGLPHGNGILADKKGNIIYEGGFRNGERIINNDMILEDFDDLDVEEDQDLGLEREKIGKFNYYGHYNYNKHHRHGRGISYFKHGTYSGDYRNDKQHGKGETYVKTKVNDSDNDDDDDNDGHLQHEGEYRNDQKHGKGIEYFENGDKYEGDFKENELHGIGKLTYNNGDIVHGEFERNRPYVGKKKFKDSEDVFVGKLNSNYLQSGKMSYRNGDVFKGEFEKNLRSHGVLTHPNGDKYIGYFDNKGEPLNGMRGTYFYRDGRQQMEGKYTPRESNDPLLQMNISVPNGSYRGEYFEDENGENIPHGTGILVSNGVAYTGTFTNGKYNPNNLKKPPPQMMIRLPIGVYTGEYIEDGNGNNIPHGTGVLNHHNGDIFEGTFVDGVQVHGKLTRYYGDIYDGDLNDNIYEGKGKLTMKNGDIYEGDFQDDVYQGKGILTKNNGDIYEGDFQDSIFHGTGNIIFKNGSDYHGQIYNGKPHGKGVYTFINKGSYARGKRIILDGIFKDGGLLQSIANENEDRYSIQIKPTHMRVVMHENGDIFEGTFDSKTGFINGTYKFAGGSIYEGPSELKTGTFHGTFHGMGKLITIENGFIVTRSGSFINGQMRGMFTETRSNTNNQILETYFVDYDKQPALNDVLDSDFAAQPSSGGTRRRRRKKGKSKKRKHKKTKHRK